MRRLITLTITMLALTSFMATTALAQNAHFISCGASGVNSDGSLTVSFKIAGLGSTPVQVNVTASATADGVFGCLNNSKKGSCPSAENKTGAVTVSSSGTFMSGRNGQITASLTVGPPSTTLTCPPGQDLVLAQISYTSVSVSSAAPFAATCTPAPNTFSANFFPNCP